MASRTRAARYAKRRKNRMAKREHELEKYQVRNYAEHRAADVRCRLPFSWLIKQSLDAIIHTARMTSNDGN